MAANDTVLGVVVMTRHGDRQGFYQSPTTYTASATAITPLGEVQEYQLGQLIRSMYFTTGSPNVITALNQTLFDQNQVALFADAGGEGGVIFDSAIAFSQGLWPATASSTTTLANGTVVTSPLGGYQYVPIQSVEPNNDISLEGWTNCNAFTTWTSQVYNSTAFLAKASESATALQALTPLAGGRAINLPNMYNIYDYINVNSIHNATFAALATSDQLAIARDLGNYHEAALFSSAQLNGVGNIAGQTILPHMFDGLNAMANSTNPLKFMLLGVSYKPFISIFNMTEATLVNPQLAGIVNYASAMTLELRQSTAEPVVRMNFKNGTDASFVTVPMFGNSGDTPLSQFKSELGPYAISTLSQWCSQCNNNSTRGCDVVAAANASSTSASTMGTCSSDAVSPVGAGFIGAGVTIAVMLAALAALFAMGFLTSGKKRGRRGASANAPSDTASDKSLHPTQEKLV